MSDHVDQMSDAVRAEAKEILAERLHHEGRRVDDLTDSELLARLDDPEIGYVGGAAQLVRDMESDW